MCGRFLLSVDPAGLQDAFPGFGFPEKIQQRFNIAPSQPILALPNTTTMRSDFFNWGLIPSWVKDVSKFKGMINARAETLSDKPSFRGSYKYRRCLIPANGFYEWKKKSNSKTKQPFFIHLKNNIIFAFAGLWDEILLADGSTIKTCTIITSEPNELIASIHNRMPVILPQDKYSEWLDPIPRTPDSLQRYLIPYPSEKMVATPVSSFVNNPANESPECTKSVLLI